MFDFEHWARWASQRAASLRQQGLAAAFTLTDASRASENPAFFVDLDTVGNMARIVVWSNGDFDLSVHLDNDEKARPVADLPRQATDDNFTAIFDRFVGAVANQ